MKGLIISVVLIFLTIGCSLAQPRTTVVTKGDSSAYTFDFGKVEEGAVLKHTFTLSNKTKKAMIIKGTHTSCGCTVSKVSKKNLMPGESVSIEATFKTKDYKGLTQQSIYVHTDDLDNPVIRFIIKADVFKKKI
jgi:hypothetical protein